MAQIRQLRTFLKEKLPEYMIPSTFVVMEALPLTPNGKVDRRALPEPNQTREVWQEAFVAPRTSVEEHLAQIWSQILDIEQVGIHDNFFELGGHSLLSAQLLFQVRETFQVELPLLSLFAAPTVALLASAVANARDRNTAQNAPLTLTSLHRDAVLESTITPEAPFIDLGTEPQQIFLTGASGFLGAFLLHELLEQTQHLLFSPC
jgi:acyl carrier protein